MSASERPTRPEADTAASLEAEVEHEAIATCGGDVRAALSRHASRERVPGGRSRTIDRSNLNRLRVEGRMPEAASASEDLDVSVHGILSSGVFGSSDCD